MTERRSFEPELRALIRAWEVLPEGRYGPERIGNWLHDSMFPAIQAARAALADGEIGDKK